MPMKRYTIHRVAHCNEGHGKVLDMTTNRPLHFVRTRDEGAFAAFHDFREKRS